MHEGPRAAGAGASLDDRDDLRRDHYIRIAGTFFAHPDLALSLADAQRLWRLDARTCEARLFELVAAEFLEVRGSLYQLSTAGE